jgi:hypothetical protein
VFITEHNIKICLKYSAIYCFQTLASNKQAITQTVKEARRAIKLLNRKDKTVAFQWVPSQQQNS